MILQKFGESLACIPILDSSGSGVKSKINGLCPKGYQELYPTLGLKGHNGQDLYAPDGVIIRAPCDGVIKEISLEEERGLGVGIITEEKFDLGEYGIHYVKVRQWHGKEILVKMEQKVKIGDSVMIADSTGYSSGSHNHFEIKPVDYIGDNLKNVYQNNGFFGAIDPQPYWNKGYIYGIMNNIRTFFKRIL